MVFLLLLLDFSSAILACLNSLLPAYYRLSSQSCSTYQYSQALNLGLGILIRLWSKEVQNHTGKNVAKTTVVYFIVTL